MSDNIELSAFDEDTLRNMSAAGMRNSQVVLSNSSEVEHAKGSGFEYAVNPFCRGQNYGTLDIAAGVVYADKACQFILHKIEQLQVRSIFGETAGAFDDFVYDDSRVTGIRTADGKEHAAALTVMACGGWTPSLVPQLDGLCETSAGSVSLFKIPRDSSSWNRLSPERFPVWT